MHVLVGSPVAPFWRAFQTFVNSPGPLAQKVTWYEQAAAIAAKPWGGLWPPEATAMNLANGLAQWQALLGETDSE